MASTSIEFSRMHKLEGFEHREFRTGWQSEVSGCNGNLAQQLVPVCGHVQQRAPVSARTR
jgi:hypothetical protein